MLYKDSVTMNRSMKSKRMNSFWSEEDNSSVGYLKITQVEEFKKMSEIKDLDQAKN